MSTTFVYIVLIALTVNFLSVAGLRCHQCNSHDNADCVKLLVNTPRAERDDQYLRECLPKDDGQAFCRKTVLAIDVNSEHRIERSCGWIKEKSHNTCFTADNEGYKQTICTCTEEGCNGASALAGISAVHLATSLGLSILMGYILRR